jgi:hypothetical protein
MCDEIIREPMGSPILPICLSGMGQAAPRRRISLGAIIARAAELALAGLGIAYFMAESDRTKVRFLALFDLVAVIYLIVGSLWCAGLADTSPHMPRHRQPRFPTGLSISGAGSVSCSPS